ncbi:DUF2098 domain-containing protein [Methanobacterium sp. CWC-01]|uniref:DUF2098 domain-containing protein n=1 Tax=Methanobacterium aridiramus TaxID=2584467 RepID=UPI0025770FA1|nr:DUF2098 domain-containing protein [Methanobacterium sp. CWC-01]WJI08860.1 DUF2098 domain-containing protein [Methanobacterium sp. CWC-01]
MPTDFKGKNIVKGTHVRYTGTGTAGEVLDVREDQKAKWAQMDSTKLWYNIRFLEVMDPEEYQKVKRRESLLEKVSADETIEQDEITRKTVEKLKKKFGEDVDMSNELCDGGG